MNKKYVKRLICDYMRISYYVYSENCSDDRLVDFQTYCSMFLKTINEIEKNGGVL